MFMSKVKILFISFPIVGHAIYCEHGSIISKSVQSSGVHEGASCLFRHRPQAELFRLSSCQIHIVNNKAAFTRLMLIVLVNGSSSSTSQSFSIFNIFNNIGCNFCLRNCSRLNRWINIL